METCCTTPREVTPIIKKQKSLATKASHGVQTTRLSFLNVCEDSSRPVLAGIDKGRHRSLPVRPSYVGTTDLFSASE